MTNGGDGRATAAKTEAATGHRPRRRVVAALLGRRPGRAAPRGEWHPMSGRRAATSLRWSWPVAGRHHPGGGCPAASRPRRASCLLRPAPRAGSATSGPPGRATRQDDGAARRCGGDGAGPLRATWARQRLPLRLPSRSSPSASFPERGAPRRALNRPPEGKSRCRATRSASPAGDDCLLKGCSHLRRVTLRTGRRATMSRWPATQGAYGVKQRCGEEITR